MSIPSKRVGAIVAVAILVSLVVLGVKVTLLLAVVAAVGYAALRSRVAGTPDVSADAGSSTTPLAPAAQTRDVGAETPRQAAASGPPVPVATANEVVEAIKRECVEKGFFVKHTVTMQKARRREPARAVMSAIAKTGKNFEVVVTVTESEYGLHVGCEWGEKAQGLASSLVVNSMGKNVKSGFNAGKSSVIKRQIPALELEMRAFQQQILNRYLAS